MTGNRVGQPGCVNALETLDTYLDNSLSQEQSQEIRAHLDSCPACMQELENRRNIRARLRSATHGIEPPPYLEGRIRAHVQTAERPQRWIFRVAAAAAMLAVVASVTIAYERGHFRYNRKLQDYYIANISGGLPTVMRVGLGDHVHCSVYRKYPANPPSVQELDDKFEPEYRGLIPIVQAHAPADYRLMMAHQCHYHGRQFVHLSLRNGSKQLSLVISKKNEGETFRGSDLLPVLSESGIFVYASGVQRFEMAAFESSNYLVYVISELPQQRNVELMRAMAPELNAFLGKIAG